MVARVGAVPPPNIWYTEPMTTNGDQTAKNWRDPQWLANQIMDLCARANRAEVERDEALARVAELEEKPAA